MADQQSLPEQLIEELLGAFPVDWPRLQRELTSLAVFSPLKSSKRDTNNSTRTNTSSCGGRKNSTALQQKCIVNQDVLLERRGGASDESFKLPLLTLILPHSPPISFIMWYVSEFPSQLSTSSTSSYTTGPREGGEKGRYHPRHPMELVANHNTSDDDIFDFIVRTTAASACPESRRDAFFFQDNHLNIFRSLSERRVTILLECFPCMCQSFAQYYLIDDDETGWNMQADWSMMKLVLRWLSTHQKIDPRLNHTEDGSFLYGHAYLIHVLPSVLSWTGGAESITEALKFIQTYLPDLLEAQNSQGSTLLHHLLRSLNPDKILYGDFSFVSGLEQLVHFIASRSACRLSDHKGDLPIHIAIENKVDCLDGLINLAPDTLNVKSSRGLFPFLLLATPIEPICVPKCVDDIFGSNSDSWCGVLDQIYNTLRKAPHLLRESQWSCPTIESKEALNAARRDTELTQNLKIEQQMGCIRMKGQGHLAGETVFADDVFRTTKIMMPEQSPREVETESKLDMTHIEAIREKVKKKRLQKRRLKFKSRAATSTAPESQARATTTRSIVRPPQP